MWIIDSAVFLSIAANLFVADLIHKQDKSTRPDAAVLVMAFLILSGFILPLWFFCPRENPKTYIAWTFLFSIIMLVMDLPSIVGSICGAVTLFLACAMSSRVNSLAAPKPKLPARDDLDW